MKLNKFKQLPVFGNKNIIQILGECQALVFLSLDWDSRQQKSFCLVKMQGWQSLVWMGDSSVFGAFLMPANWLAGEPHPQQSQQGQVPHDADL